VSPAHASLFGRPDSIEETLNDDLAIRNTAGYFIAKMRSWAGVRCVHWPFLLQKSIIQKMGIIPKMYLIQKIRRDNIVVRAKA
jgi:hypothetical protein